MADTKIVHPFESLIKQLEKKQKVDALKSKAQVNYLQLMKEQQELDEMMGEGESVDGSSADTSMQDSYQPPVASQLNMGYN